MIYVFSIVCLIGIFFTGHVFIRGKDEPQRTGAGVLLAIFSVIGLVLSLVSHLGNPS